MKNTDHKYSLSKTISLLLIACIFISGVWILHRHDFSRILAKAHNIARKPHTPNPLYDTVYGYGIDLSHHNAEPDWNKLEVDFVILKATEGRNFKDPQFLSRKKQCNQVGIPVGAYHFFSGLGNAEEEYLNFKEVIDSGLDIVPVLDIERKPKNISKKAFQDKFKEFCSLFYKDFNCLPIIYTSEGFYIAYLQKIIDGHFRPSVKPLLWFGDVDQDYSFYTNTPEIHQAKITSVKGCIGKVDLNELHIPLDTILWEK